MKIWMACICALSLVGCVRLSDLEAEKEEIETIKQVEEDKKEWIVDCTKEDLMVHLEAKDDEVKMFKQTFYMTLSDLGVDANQGNDKIQEQVSNAAKALYDEILGVNVRAEYLDGRVKITIEINYEVANIDALIEAGLLDKGEIESQYVSFELTKAMLQKDGFACQVIE